MNPIPQTRFRELIDAVHAGNYVGSADAATFGEIEDWDTSLVEDMEGAFQGWPDFNRDISRWNTSRVVSMYCMFWGVAAFNQPIGRWDTARVTDMRYMFYGAHAFNQPLEGWDVGAVTNMSHMFCGARAFHQELGRWNVGSVTRMDGMFDTNDAEGHIAASLDAMGADDATKAWVMDYLRSIRTSLETYAPCRPRVVFEEDAGEEEEEQIPS